MSILKSLLLCLLAVFSLSALNPPGLIAADYELYIAQGIQKINEESYDEALKVLKKALSMSPNDPEATYYTGIAHSRLGEYNRAEKLLLKTISLEPDAVNAFLELGNIYTSTGKCGKASDNLSKFISRTDNENAKQYAIRLKNRCKKEAKKGEKRFTLNVTAGAQHDSNVILEPSNPPANAAARERKEDGRGVVLVSARGTVFRSGPIKLKAGASIYNSQHGHLEEYNIQYYKFRPVIVWDVADPVTATAGYTLDYTLLGNDLYRRTHMYHGKLKVKEGGNMSTEGIYEYRDLKYWDDVLFTTNSMRTGHQNTVGLKQNFYVDKFYASLYGYADFNRADVKYWSYDGWRAGVEASYRITSALKVRASGEYIRHKHKDIFMGYTAKRSDKRQRYRAGLTCKISKKLSIMVADTYTINDSNLLDYDYERNVAGIFLKAGIL